MLQHQQLQGDQTMNASQSQPSSAASRVTPIGAKKNRILIIDDDMDMSAAIQYRIESLQSNIQCKTINDPYEALLELIDHQYDFVLIDQRIPGLLGSSILKQVDKFIDEDSSINESGRFKEPVPVIIMSAEEINIGHGLRLKNFKLIRKLNKKDLPQFLTESFAH